MEVGEPQQGRGSGVNRNTGLKGRPITLYAHIQSQFKRREGRNPDHKISCLFCPGANFSTLGLWEHTGAS